MRSVAVSIGPGEGGEKPETPSKLALWRSIALWVARGIGGGYAGTAGAHRAIRRLVPGSAPRLAVMLPTVQRSPNSGRRRLGDRVGKGLEELAASALVRAGSHLPRGVRALELCEFFQERVTGDLRVPQTRLALLLASRTGDDEAQPDRAARERGRDQAPGARRGQVMDPDRERRELRIIGS